MLWIVAYDITCDRRRSRIHYFLKTQGIGTQKSVFVCDLSVVQLYKLNEGLKERIDPAEDHLRLYPLCSRCNEQTYLFGQRAEWENHGGFLIV